MSLSRNHSFEHLSTINLVLGSQIDHSIMSFLMVRNMKHLLVNLLMTLEALQKRTSETTLPIDADKNDVSLSSKYPPLNAVKLEVDR